MKNQKGITLTVLVMTLVIMGLVLGAISYNSVAGLRMKSYYDMCADIELLDEKIALYYLQHKNDNDGSLHIPITNETKTITEIISDYDENNVNYNPNNLGQLHEIDLSKLENLSLNIDTTKYSYYIDEQSHTIYSSHGVNLDGYIYYTAATDYESLGD